MKNHSITTKLNAMMMQEMADKHQAISLILMYYKEFGTISSIEQEFDVICELQSLHLGDLNQILGDLISDLESRLFARLKS